MASPEQQTQPAASHAGPPARPDDEVAVLRARVAALEAELAEVHRRANAAIAAAQDRAYWLDRWHIDLNALMRRRGAGGLRTLLRALRAPIRLARKARRQISR
jgi:hypothetical protein